MNSPILCQECKSPTHLASKMNSGNATFETWQCDSCMWRKTFCSGVNQ